MSFISSAGPRLRLTAATLLLLILAAPASIAQRVGWIEIEGGLQDRPEPYAAMFGAASKATLLEVISAVDESAALGDMSALVLRLREPTLTMSQVEELGAALQRFRDQGKTVHVFTEMYGPVELVLSDYVDEVIAQAGASVSLPGLYMEEMFLADTLGMIGVEADFVQVGDYKGASEQFANTRPSEEWSHNINHLLDGMYENLRSHIKDGRGMSNARLDSVMEQAFMLSPEDARKLGLVDAVVDRLDLDGHLRNRLGEFTYEMDIIPEKSASTDLSNPFAMLQMLSEPRQLRIRRDSIAVLHISGAIIDGESTDGAFGGSSVGSVTIREALAQIENEPRIKGAIIRVNSPGGSAIASESIWIGARRVAEKKPVWVSVGDMAASGGYYIAVAGDRIYVNPASIVGSIGVVGGKFALAGLYDKLNINVVPRTRGPRAGMFGSLQTWSEDERDLVRQRMTETYDQFVRRVRAGRDGIDISTTAEGRLFTGRQAIEMNMADALGGVDAAIKDLASAVDLSPAGYDVVHFPAPKSLAERLEEMFGGFGIASAPSRSSKFADAAVAFRSIIGERNWGTFRDALNAMMQLREEPVLLTLPRIIMTR